MRTKAAIIREPGKPWEITELELDEPKVGEVRIAFHASGMCHSDEHLRTGDSTGRLPMVGGHEGAGVIEAVGPDVTRVKVGDHVVCSFIPACGTCRYCSTGHQNLCDWGAQMMTGMLADGTFRFHDDAGADLGGFCMLGTFAERAVVSQNSCVPIDRDIPFEVAALTGCGVPTGWGTAVYAAGVRAGETVVIELVNKDEMPHNLVVGKEGALETVGLAADRMVALPDAFAKNFVPATPEVLYAIRLLQPGETVQARFTAPAQPGNYPFICTFPAHWRTMNGIIEVRPAPSQGSQP